MRDFFLRLCLRTYPATCRKRDGRAILDLARDLSSQGDLAFIREAVGLLAGGLRAHARALRLDLTGAPWRAARERLALPLAVGMLCVLVAFLVRSDFYDGVGWWAVLTPVVAVCAVAGAAFGRRYLMMAASSVLLVLVVLNALVLLADSNRGGWLLSANIGTGGDVGNVDVLAMWLPVAMLLVVCSGAVGKSERPRRRDQAWIVVAPVVASGLVAARGQSLLGAVLIYAPLLLVAGTIFWGAIRKNSVTRAAASLLVAASCFPVLWLVAFVIPYPSALEPYFPLLYFGAGAVVASVMIRFLLRDHSRTVGT